MKTCISCNLNKELPEFAAHPANKDGRAGTCKLCRHHYHRAWRHGISTEQWNRMFEVQGSHCAICARHQSELKMRLVLDHCHKTNVIIGLLCSQCNAAIGMFRDDPEVLRQAITYLTKPKLKAI